MHAYTEPTPIVVWVSLAPLLAARNSMRVWRGADAGYDQGRRLATTTLPPLPAALPLFTHIRRTSILGLDFDATHHGENQVRDDVADAVALIEGAGGLTIVDRSPSGGMHIWVPLWSEAAHRPEALRPMLEAMRRRWRTLDITPMTNSRTGCLTAPGSRCIGGGFRQLITPLDRAIHAARGRSPAGTLGKINTALGAFTFPQPDSPTVTPSSAKTRKPVARGQRREDLPSPYARAFATDGVLPAHRPDWTRSHARQNVLTWAVRANWSLDEVEERMRTGHWVGLSDAYAKYGSASAHRLACDWDRALAWADTVPPDIQVLSHQHKHTGGRKLRRWVAQARKWVRLCPLLEGQVKATALCVLQALASGASKTGRMVLAMGGRWLSIGAGLLSEPTVWATLRVLRELDGSPLRWVQAHVGSLADEYELVAPHLNGDEVEVTEDEVDAASTAGVAPVWKIIGHRAREVFELVDALGPQSPDGRVRSPQVLVRASSSRAATYEAIRLLERWGLLQRGRGWVRRTELTLDEIAAEHGVRELVAERIERHRAQRQMWWELLALWNSAPSTECPPAEQVLPPDPMPLRERETWLEIVMATGPPEDPYALSAAEVAEQNLVELLTDMLGATPLTPSACR